MSEITIEQFGGVVGPGLPGGHLHMRGSVAWSALAVADRAKLDVLFAAKRPIDANLYYRLTRAGPKGVETVDVSPDAVPQALIASVKTTLD